MAAIQETVVDVDVLQPVPPANQPASAPQSKVSIFKGIFSKLVAVGCENIMFGLIVLLFYIGLLIVLPMMMIVYGSQNNAVICESPCIGSCGEIQRSHVLHTPPIGISVPQALSGSGIIYMVLAIACAISYRCKFVYAKYVYLSATLILFVWACICINIVHSMNMQCKNYDTSSASASIVSMEPKLLLGVNIGVLLLSINAFVIVILYFYNKKNSITEYSI